MIIGPEAGYHLDKVKEHLLANLNLDNYEILDSRTKDEDQSLTNGYRLLHEGTNKNLGWRMVMHVDPPENIAGIVLQSHESGKGFEELLPEDYKQKHMLAVNQPPENNTSEQSTETPTEPKQKIKILLTNYLGSKGLSALHVFVVGINNYTFPSNPNSIKDEEVCKFIVALTRTKNSCSLVTNKEYDRSVRKILDRPSIFLSWLPQDKLQSNKYRVQTGQLLEE
jgi:superfamily I DNA/RNA helicase